jgi:2-oxoglutarate ferredoxin oxidoreductase subunit beta
MGINLAEHYLNRKQLPHIWCAGCGNGIVLGALTRALANLGLDKKDVVVVTGIGCWGKADDYLTTNAFHGTHGRALAFATGIKAANPELTVIVLMGDGDGATIGGNHLIHSARRNIGVTSIVVNNLNYGMTGGQYSATTPQGRITSTSKYGNPEKAMDLCALVSAAGASYVARSTAYHVTQLDSLIKKAITHKGFSFVEVISPCPTHFGRRNKLGSPIEMMKQLKEQGLNKVKYDMVPDEEKSKYFLIGKMVDRDEPDFNERYETIRNRVLEAGKDRRDD